MAARNTPEKPRDPTLREMRATLSKLWWEADQAGPGHKGDLLRRAYSHMAWLVDAFLFDTDESADDGGRS